MYNFLILIVSLSWADHFVITETSLKELSQSDTPELEKVISRFKQAQYTLGSVNDQFRPQAYSQALHVTTREKAIVSFQPVFSPQNTFTMGMKKNSQYGLSTDLSVSYDVRSGRSAGAQALEFNNATTLLYSINVSMDLWKDILGRLSKKKLENAKYQFESAKIQKEIGTKAFWLGVKKVYWSLLANNEKIKISKALLKTAKTQAADAKRRRKNSVADDGEVARYESQVHARRGSLIAMEYEKELLFKQLQTLLPELSHKELILGDYSTEQATEKVLACTVQIGSQLNAPLDDTLYDEMNNLVERIQNNQETLDEAYQEVDLQLSATAFATGVASEVNEAGDLFEGSFADAQTDLRDNDRSGFRAALSLTIPLSSKVKDTRESLKIYNRKKLKAQIKEVNTKLKTTHQKTIKYIELLQNLIQAQKSNSKMLTIRLAEMRKKYKQARISVSELIQDQDAKMNSDLSVIDTQLQVVNTVIDYLMVFTNTPCAFNK